MSAETERDQYGFAVKPGQKKESSEKKLKSKYTWEHILKDIDGDISLLESSPALVDLIIRDGIPTSIRGKVWYQLSKASESKFGLMSYVQILETFQGQESEFTLQIEKDLKRTFPDNEVFESDEGISALRRVLVAYSWLNPEIGYCQSMNFIAALFLLFMDEEDAFWLMRTTMETILPLDYYTPGMQGVRADERIVLEILAHKLPKVNSHLQKFEINLSGFLIGWFMSIFINILPLEVSTNTLSQWK